MVFPYVDKEPIIFLGIQTKTNAWLQVQAYVDSGASVSVFGADIAEYLGINLTSGNPKYLLIADGSKIKVYIHEIKVRFLNSEFKAKIAFSDSFGVSTNILGQKSFFENFTFCFQSWRHRLEVLPKSQP